MIITVFSLTTPKNTSFTYRASPSTNPNPMISLAFVEENYDVLESLLRKRRRQIRHEDLQTKLEYFSEDYDEEREMEPRPKPNREATPTLRPRSPMVCRQRERIMGFEEAPNREGSRRGRNAEGKTLKDQENPIRTITVDRKIGIGSPHTEDLATDCSPPCPKAQERSSPQKRQLEASNSLLVGFRTQAHGVLGGLCGKDLVRCRCTGKLPGEDIQRRNILRTPHHQARNKGMSFESKGADKTHPFMRTLKNCTSGKMVQWTAEADEAFRRMKEVLEALPTGAELGFPELEKLILAARTLRRYFQAHLIQVLSDKLIKQILARPEKSGRIAKWAIDLGEHKIEFRGRNSVKGQILADFLAETPLKKEEGAKDEEAKRKEPEPEKAWKLFTDEASSSDSSGVGLILVSPEGKEYTYAIRFEFKTTNNEAEYEALLEGLRIAKEIRV
uniref:Putative reverse transcriptase domain, ribonuclease H-like domain protein n=1 Tax=Tanacetum cinerariifolium TaxID=118510 RepID=A0A6L2MN16_TANCI|nr:putative reverse transcriptase domain, ribonuclease H-like domain protein [Tanacetum cinerariifolium]